MRGSRAAPTPPKRSYSRRSKRAVDRDRSRVFLDELVRDSEYYRTLLEPSFGVWTKQEVGIRESIEALNLFRVAQPLPMMLALLRTYRLGDLSMRQVRNAFGTMEKFHLMFTAVTSQRTGGGTGQMYAAAARQLTEASNTNERGRVLRDFVGKLKDRVPTYEEFSANFLEIRFDQNQTKSRGLVRYLLRHFYDHYRRGQEPVDYSRLTIEHLAPQSNPGEGVGGQSVGVLGNLIFVEGGLNEKLATKSFHDKQKVLVDNNVPLDPILQGATTWSDAEINERTKLLAKTAFEEIFRF